MSLIKCPECGTLVEDINGTYNCKICKLTEEQNGLTVFMCGASKCKHEWDGPERITDDGRGAELTCSKCGMGAMEDIIWNGP